MQRSAFSLVELSIVLVILGLLTGGILAGQSLIRAAELRSLSTDIQRYMTASHTFRDKYFALPGDMTNATKFWGKDAAQCNSDPASAGTPGTCNGNGNGRLEHAAGASLTGESFTYWQHLSSAGLIEGTYTGIAGSGTTYPGRHAVLGENAPRAKISNAGYYVEYNSGSNFGITATNYLMVGNTEAVGSPTWVSFLKSEEMWNIDTKVDDGRPGTGKMVASESLVGTCVTTSIASTSQYKLDTSGTACHIYIVNYL